MGKFQDLAGKRFGRFTVIEPVPCPKTPKDGRYWLCRCDCGNERVYKSSEINRGATLSCGCYGKEIASKRAYEKHLTHGMSGSRIYFIWSSMKARCYNAHTKEYRLYGGRGITVCDEWLDNFESFRDWAYTNGYDENAPRGRCTLDRIDVNGNYEPSNCRITDQKTQSRNRRTTRLITYHGETKSIAEWAEQYGLRQSTLYDRLSYGWTFEKCLTQPVRHW